MTRSLPLVACLLAAGPLAAAFPQHGEPIVEVVPVSLPSQVTAPTRDPIDKGKLPAVALACGLTLPGSGAAPEALRLPGLPENIPQNPAVIGALCAAVQNGTRLR